MCEQGACVAGGHAWAGDMHGRGACVAGGHALAGERAWQVGGVWVGGMCGRGACMPHMPPWTLRDMVGQCTGGTHPTGMHSCCQM